MMFEVVIYDLKNFVIQKILVQMERIILPLLKTLYMYNLLVEYMTYMV